MACLALGAVGAAVSLFGSKSKNNAAKQAAEAQRKAAELQTLVARELHDHWKQFYMACDAATITEVCAIPVYAAAYAEVESRVRLAGIREFGRARLQAETCQANFCVTNADCNFLSGVEAQAIVDTMNFGFRREEGVKIQVDQIRLENKRSFLALGRGLLKQSSDAANLAAKLGAALKGWLGSPTQGWLEFAGFLGSPEGKRFGDDVVKSVRGLLGSPETPPRNAASGQATTVANSDPRDLFDESGTPTITPASVALPTPAAASEIGDAGGNLGNSIGLPPGAMNLTGGPQ